jgi:hypothetical protein
MLRLGSFWRVALKRVARPRSVWVVSAFFHRGFDIISKSGVTGTALAAHLNCTRETISDYVAKGVVVKLASGNYDIDECRNRTFAYLREKAAGHSCDLTNERALLAKEQRDALLTGRAGRPEELPNPIEATRVSLRLGQLAGSRHHQLDSGQLLFCQSNCYGVIPIIDRFYGLQEEVAILRGH